MFDEEVENQTETYKKQACYIDETDEAFLAKVFME